MPTGYTGGILDGKTKDFKQFAKDCSRAFIIHLRDEPAYSEYKEREPGDYHIKAIKKAKNDLNQIETLSDEEILNQEKNMLIESKERYSKLIEENRINKLKLEQFLEEAKSYKPPTEKHIGIAKFMVEQLEKTIDFDCNGNYKTKELTRINLKLNNLNAEDIRSEMKMNADKDIEYHTRNHEEELARCKDHNNWYSDFINSL